MTVRRLVRRLLPALVTEPLARARSRLRAREPVAVAYGPYTLRCPPGHQLPRLLARWPDYGKNLADVVNALAVAEPRVIDVGANIGDTALLLARFVPGVRVLCVEGHPGYWKDLATNTAALACVTRAQAVLGERSGVAPGSLVAAAGSAHLAGGGSVEMVALDALVRAHPEFAAPHVLKIDTDGWETAILRGARGVLAAARPVVFYEWDPEMYAQAGAGQREHVELLRALGYEAFVVYTNRGELMLKARELSPEMLDSLAAFARARRAEDGWHWDLAAFAPEHAHAWERL